MTITFTTTDHSPYTKSIPTGWITAICNTAEQGWKPTPIRNWFHYVAIFDHGLSHVRIYQEGHLDKVMISGIDASGIRVRILVNKYPKRKKSRNRWFHTKEGK